MNNRVLLDSSILIEVQKGDVSVSDRLFDIKNRVCISRVTAYEIIHGSRDKEELRKNKSLLGRIEIIEIDEEISKQAYGLLETYVLKSRLNLPDALIAASALVHSLPLWTTNIRHFQPIKEIELFKE